MRKSLALLFVLSLIVSSFAHSQDKRVIDSLETLVKSNIGDSLKQVAFSDLCYNYSFIDFDKAISNGKEALLLAKKLNNPKAIALAFSDIGNCYTRVNKLNEALDYHKKAYALRKQLC